MRVGHGRGATGTFVRVLARFTAAEPERGVADADDVLLRQHLARYPLAVDVRPAVAAQVDDLEAAGRMAAQLRVMPETSRSPVSAMSFSGCRPIRIVLAGRECASVMGQS
jgi:hypothetical protein